MMNYNPPEFDESFIQNDREKITSQIVTFTS